jgi:uncharacterized protein YgiM (DUF1202 family)
MNQKNQNWKNWTIIILVIFILLLLLLRPRANIENTVITPEVPNFDLERVVDVSNIILAIQDYYYQKSNLPNDLEMLRAKDFLTDENRIIDPETGLSYYYTKRDIDFVLCVTLSTGIHHGFNVDECDEVETNYPMEKVTPEFTETQEAISQKDGNPMQSPQTEGKLTITASSSFLRAEATRKSEAVASAFEGDTYTFTNKKGDWYEVTISKNKSGWLKNENVSIEK